jgi:hypothetical protein
MQQRSSVMNADTLQKPSLHRFRRNGCRPVDGVVSEVKGERKAFLQIPSSLTRSIFKKPGFAPSHSPESCIGVATCQARYGLRCDRPRSFRFSRPSFGSLPANFRHSRNR